MAADRMLHKRAGVGDRTNQLSHLEWRVWTIYQLAADDFGVMPNHEQALIDAHPCLAKVKPRAQLKAALGRLVKLRLVLSFKDAHGQEYVYQPDWQDFQKLEWTQVTTRPCPPAEALDQCTDATKRLFSTWPGGTRVPADPDRRRRARDEDATRDNLATPSRLSRESVATPSRERSDGIATPSLPRARVRPKGSDTDSDTGSGFGRGAGEGPPVAEGAGERLWERWRALMADRVRLPLTPSAVDAMKLVEACQRVPDESRRLAALERFVRLNDEDRKRLNVKSWTLGYFVMALPDLVAGGGAGPRAVCRYRHDPPCPDDAACTARYLREQRDRVPA